MNIGLWLILNNIESNLEKQPDDKDHGHAWNNVCMVLNKKLMA